MNLTDDPEVATLRVPPRSIEAESAILGALLLDNSAWDRIGDILTDFFGLGFADQRQQSC
jgi:replicative DNA helicase